MRLEQVAMQPCKLYQGYPYLSYPKNCTNLLVFFIHTELPASRKQKLCFKIYIISRRWERHSLLNWKYVLCSRLIGSLNVTGNIISCISDEVMNTFVLFRAVLEVVSPRHDPAVTEQKSSVYIFIVLFIFHFDTADNVFIFLMFLHSALKLDKWISVFLITSLRRLQISKMSDTE